MEYRPIYNKYIEQAVKDSLIRELRPKGIKSIQILDINEVNHFGGTAKLFVLVKHKMVKDGEREYNCSAFVILTHYDWTLSQSDVIGTAQIAGNGDYQFFKPVCDPLYIDIEDFAYYLGMVRNRISGEY